MALVFSLAALYVNALADDVVSIWICFGSFLVSCGIVLVNLFDSSCSCNLCKCSAGFFRDVFFGVIVRVIFWLFLIFGGLCLASRIEVIFFSPSV